MKKYRVTLDRLELNELVYCMSVKSIPQNKQTRDRIEIKLRKLAQRATKEAINENQTKPDRSTDF